MATVNELDERLDEEPVNACVNCGDFVDGNEPACECCPSCNGQGFTEDGGCGGGCDFCRPFPKCDACGGSGKGRATARGER